MPKPFENEFEKIKELLSKNPRGMTILEISKQIDMNRNSVAKYLAILQTSGAVDSRAIGPAKIFFPSQRVSLNTVINYTKDPIFVLNDVLKIVKVNDAGLSILEKERDEVINQDFKEVLSKIFDINYLQKYIDESLNGKQFSGEIESIDKLLFFSIKTLPSIFDNGEKGITIILDDITDQKIARENSEMLASIVKSTNSLILSIDKEFKIRSWNKAGKNSFGYDEEEILGKKIFEIIPEKSHKTAEKLILKAFSGEQIENLICERIAKSGEIKKVNISYSPIKNSKNEVVAISSIVTDITNDIKLKNELENFFNLTLDLVCIGGFDGYFKKINPQWEKVLGWSEEELLAVPWIEFVHPDDRKKTIEEGEAIFKGKKTVKFENRYKTKSGNYVKFSWNAIPDLENKLIHCIVRIID